MKLIGTSILVQKHILDQTDVFHAECSEHVLQSIKEYEK
jgi:hypothetical protein